MAEEKKKNIYQRLMQARIDFASKNIQPSGYNLHLDFNYLELKDIVPVANEIMQNNGIVLVTSFSDTECIGKVVDLNGEEEPIVFSIPLPNPEKDAERLKLNVVAMVGSQVTYLRRYMIMLVLDICINDEVDADGDDTPVVKPNEKSTPNKKKSTTKTTTKPKATTSTEVKTASKATTSVKPTTSAKPATPEKRAEIKKELMAVNGNADDLQIQTLMSLAMRWKNAIPSDEKMITEIMVTTNGFSKCTRKEADELIDAINKKISDAKKE